MIELKQKDEHESLGNSGRGTWLFIVRYGR